MHKPLLATSDGAGTGLGLSADEVPLPPGWEMRVHPQTEEHYFVDTATKETAWELPDGYALPLIPSTWECHIDADTGQRFFYDSVNGEDHDNLPIEFQARQETDTGADETSAKSTGPATPASPTVVCKPRKELLTSRNAKVGARVEGPEGPGRLIGCTGTLTSVGHVSRGGGVCRALYQVICDHADRVLTVACNPMF